MAEPRYTPRPLSAHDQARQAARAAARLALSLPPTLPAPGGPDPPGGPLTSQHGAQALVPKIIG